MSLSTTTSAAYVLTKYSRSYPSADSSSGTHGSQLGENAEWQHFTNPIIRLMLDMRKSSDDALQSFRMRIVWSISAHQNTMDMDHREVVFEDVDLLSFSDTPFMSARSVDTGLPLKAVFRDCVVGIRYLYPRIVPAGHRPVYRRFQINFRAAAEAANFIESIRKVCPCKENPPPMPGRTMTMTAIQSQRKTSGTAVNTSASLHRHEAALERLPSSAVPQTLASSFDPTAADKLLQSTASVLPSAMHATVSSGPCASISNVTAVSSLAQSITHINRNATVQPDCDGSVTFSGPSQAEQTNTIPSPHDISMSAEYGIAAKPIDPRTNLVKALREIPPLYDLPTDDLEKVVAQVVREDGFVKLLENLDAMWKIKGVLDHPTSSAIA
ncbi:hypothetical protein K474DRAFT_1600389 [Panus rudis PR-1116 ss-1]|nr:hypothetical protein K474DRAFT_1600389 [Panus rudis PR-1116 ss-1]